MKTIKMFYYLLRRIFGKPNNYHIIIDVNDAKNYKPIGRELLFVHRDYDHIQRNNARWRLTREQIVNGLEAQALIIVHYRTENFGWLDISYIQPCVKK